MQNIFDLPANLSNDELFEVLLSQSNLKIERIISTGQTTAPGNWYDQEQAEWVILLQGEARITYEDGSSHVLRSGDYLLIPPHQKHRVDYTSSEPPCIWLAVHFHEET
ncbi:MAG TPA: cupin domain-containing protein [Allocoleopsis sp.]